MPSFRRVKDPLSELDRLGQLRLKRAIRRGVRILRTRPRCLCRNPTSFRRKGIAYVCDDCGGWVPANIAQAIKRELRKERRSETLSRVVHVRRRRFL